MKRAVEDVGRVLKIREEKPPLQQMVREGIIGEDLWNKIIKAEQEVEIELNQVDFICDDLALEMKLRHACQYKSINI